MPQRNDAPSIALYTWRPLNKTEVNSFSFFQTTESGQRYENLASIVKQISPRKDLNVFSKTLHIPESFTVSRHVFAPPDVPPALVRLKKRPLWSKTYLIYVSIFFCSLKQHPHYVMKSLLTVLLRTRLEIGTTHWKRKLVILTERVIKSKRLLTAWYESKQSKLWFCVTKRRKPLLRNV